jgi:hypothetical protein
MPHPLDASPGACNRELVRQEKNRPLHSPGGHLTLDKPVSSWENGCAYQNTFGIFSQGRESVPSHPRRSLKILHTADIHLDSDSYGNAEQRQAHCALYRRCLQAIVDRAIAEAVDVVLIAGDLFDHNRALDETVLFVQEQLQRLQQPVVILPGNHDCLCTNAIYDRHDLTAACRNVHVITALHGQTIEFPQLDLVLWGRAMEEHEPGFHPLANIPSVPLCWRESVHALEDTHLNPRVICGQSRQ